MGEDGGSADVQKKIVERFIKRAFLISLRKILEGVLF